MSRAIDNGGQAFPSHPILYSSEDAGEAQGMTLRDWFAGQAMAGLLAAKGYHLRQVAAIDAYNIADATITLPRSEYEQIVPAHISAAKLAEGTR